MERPLVPLDQMRLPSVSWRIKLPSEVNSMVAFSWMGWFRLGDQTTWGEFQMTSLLLITRMKTAKWHAAMQSASPEEEDPQMNPAPKEGPLEVFGDWITIG